MEYLKYLVDNEYWYFELDEDRYATKQIVIDDKGYHLSCFEDCLAEGVVDPDGFDGDGISWWISSDEFYSEWNHFLSMHAEAWNATKAKYAIGSLCSGHTKAFYPQGQIIEGTDFSIHNFNVYNKIHNFKKGIFSFLLGIKIINFCYKISYSLLYNYMKN